VRTVVGSPASATVPGTHYRHEAFFYHSGDEFYDVTLRFVRQAVAADQPVLVALAAPKIDRLRSELGGLSDAVHFADMTVLGANPARIIPAWSDFLQGGARSDSGFRGIGEPIVAGQRPAHLSECHRHEALLNLAFADLDDADFWLLCPYDTSTLDDGTLDEARRNHPMVQEHGASVPSPAYPGAVALAEPLLEALPDPSGPTGWYPFGEGDLADVRRSVIGHAHQAGMGDERLADLVLAVNEIATNSLRYGGLRGELRIWVESGSLICEIRDSGFLADPLVGRQRPSLQGGGGRGLWLANQLCDLVQIRTLENGNVVRLHSRLDRPDRPGELVS
jgi:anti-sigma regulatory factor (Ser/Thr protein kinase)